MKIYQLKTEIWLPRPRDEVFRFFADPKNLERLTPTWLSFKLSRKIPAAINKGSQLNYRLRIHGVPIRWQSLISDWEPPHRFVDRQTRGPYRLWVHEHNFTEDRGGTLVGDKVEYSVPGGSLVQKFIVAPDLERIFKYRHTVLQEIFNPENQTSA
jgi:ligand-binding SRPBCC domain-containing protein